MFTKLERCSNAAMLLDSSLLYFYEVARCGSIRQAAQQLHISPSAISRMISKAEHHFQTELFERRASGMILTATGRALVDELSGTIAHLKDARTRIDEIKGLRRGEVSLHCIEGFANEIIPRFLTTFHNDYPDVSFTVNTGGSDQIIEALMSDSADLGMTYNMRRRSDIEVLLSVRQPLCALVSTTHPLARRRRLSLHEIARHPVALPNPSFGTRNLVDRAMRSLHIDKLPVMVTTNSLALTYGMAYAGSCITLSVPLAARRAVLSGQLVAINITENKLLVGTVAVCKRRGRRLSAAANELVEYIGREFTNLQANARPSR